MLLNYLASEPYVQLGFLAAIVAIVLASLASSGSRQNTALEIADRPAARAHEADMWRSKQGAIEHKKKGD